MIQFNDHIFQMGGGKTPPRALAEAAISACERAASLGREMESWEKVKHG